MIAKPRTTRISLPSGVSFIEGFLLVRRTSSAPEILRHWAPTASESSATSAVAGLGPLAPGGACPLVVAAVHLAEGGVDVPRLAHGGQHVVDAALAGLLHQVLRERQRLRVEAAHAVQAAVTQGADRV